SGPVSAYFTEITPEPLASGSVAQTHRARLLNGRDVIIKIQRPHLPEIIEQDLTLLIRLSRRVPKAFLPMVDLPEVLQQIKESLTREIDFRNEAQAMITFAELNQNVKCVAIPEVYDEFTTPRMIVEDYVSGIPINHYDELLKAGYDLEDVGKKLMLSFIKQVFKDGFFHGDPHPGNLFISEGKIYFIDFGIMGKLENGMRVALNDILYSFTAQDVEGMMQGILAVTSFDTSMNKTALAQDVERMLAKYSSLDIGALSITDLIEDLLNVFVKNGLKASPQITILEKAALQIEGIFRELAPEVDLMTLAKNYFLENMGPDMLKQALNKETLLIELFYQLKNGKNIPRRLNQLLEQVLNGRILVNHDLYDYTNRIKFFNRVANRFVVSILFFAVLMAAVILSFNPQMTPVSIGLFAMSGLLFVWDLLLILKK
ncbi:MAG: AarF/ABC1/UbiB kinase family protein, partial [Streptococcus equinus]|nr:AarF/ABC1/UbiB kinase family protein [Streptococcus equinus]